MPPSLPELLASTPLSGANATYLEALYEQYLLNPDSVDPAWRGYFDALAPTTVPERAHRQVIAGVAGLLDVRGLMAMGPSTGDPSPAFIELRTLRDQAEQRLSRRLPVLSMGMTGDFEAALAAGSTMLRLGTALFGPRPASPADE